MTATPDRRLAAYLTAAYEFSADDGNYLLRPGEFEGVGVGRLAGLCREWTFISACNPAAGALCDSENRARHEDLERELDRRGWRHLAAARLDPAGEWPDEPGFVVLDRPLAEVAELGRELDQAALLHGGDGEAPRVVALDPAWLESEAGRDGRAVMAPYAQGPGPAPDGMSLVARGLGFSRGPDWIFRDLDFRVTPGRVLLAEGANGSGKTTLVRVLAGLLEFHAGELTWHGASVTPGSERLRGEMLYLGHRLAVKDELTALENVSFLCGLHGRPEAEADCDRALARLGLAGLQDAHASRLSAGQRKRVALARLALDSRPLWLLDEPYANLDREGAAVVSQLIADHAAGGGLTVLTAHEGLTPDLPHLERLPLGDADG